MGGLLVFKGRCTEAGPVVEMHEGSRVQDLLARPDLTNSPPGRYAWGRTGGGGCEQLAAALLSQVLDSDLTTRLLVAWFASEIVWHFKPTWQITSEQVYDWVLTKAFTVTRKGMPRPRRKRGAA